MTPLGEGFDDAFADPEGAGAEARSLELFDRAPVMLWMVGTDGRSRFFNKQWLDFRGRLLKEEAGTGWMEGLHPEDAERIAETRANAFASRAPFEAEYRLRRGDGAYRWVLEKGVPRFSADGTFEGFVGSAFDMTDRKETEKSLQLAREVFQRVFRASPAAVMVVDAERRIQDVNDRALELLGYGRDELVGRPVADLNLWGDPSEREAVVEQLVKEGSVRGVKSSYRNRNGEVRPAFLSMEIIELPDGPSPVVLAMFADARSEK